jgi:hypothetical protein
VGRSGGGSESHDTKPVDRRERWWTRTQSIRAAAALPFEAALVETAEPPAYQRIARKALQLRELRLSDRVIAARLGVTDKTVAKGVRWLRPIGRRGGRSEPGS